MSAALNVIFTDEFSASARKKVLKVYQNIQDILKNLGILDEPDYQIYIYKTLSKLKTEYSELPPHVLKAVETAGLHFLNIESRTFLKMNKTKFEEAIGLEAAIHFLLFQQAHPSDFIPALLCDLQYEFATQGFDPAKLEWLNVIGMAINHFFVWKYIIEHGGKKWLLESGKRETQLAQKVLYEAVSRREVVKDWEVETLGTLEMRRSLVEGLIASYIPLDLMGCENPPPAEWGPILPQLFALYDHLKIPFLPLMEFPPDTPLGDLYIQLFHIVEAVLQVLQAELYPNDAEFGSILREISSLMH